MQALWAAVELRLTHKILRKYWYLPRINITWEVQRITYSQVDMKPLTFADSDKLMKGRLIEKNNSFPHRLCGGLNGQWVKGISKVRDI